MARSPSAVSLPRADRVLWPAALAGTACLLLAAPFAGDAGTGWTAAWGGAALAVLVLLDRLRRRHRGAAAEAARAAEQARRADADRRARLETQAALVREEAEYLVRTRIAAVLDGEPVPPPLHGGLLDEGVARELERVLDVAADAVEEGRERRESLRLAVVALARRVQAAAHRIQEEASLMADRHPGNADVLATSMGVDHSAAQQARLAQSLAVLCGEGPGQQWQEPLALVDVVRAASGRITAYRRVEVSGDPDVAAAAQVVEPLIHLVAELLANATQSSPPATAVTVTVRPVQRGAVVEIDDGGVGMDDHALEQAREVVSGRRELGIGEVGEVPQTGLAVVGRYARRHGFGADLMPSPYGGVRAVVLVPAEAVEMLEPAGTVPVERDRPRPAAIAGTPAADGSRTAAAGGPSAAPAGGASAAPAGGAGGPHLPQRRSLRGRPATGTDRDRGQEAAEPGGHRAAPTPQQAGEWMAAYFRGSQGAVTGARDDKDHTDDTDDTKEGR
ncbi:ATP-binding protein [Streptomyces sp. SCUT-3]|uniref:ATP-binding protein n=1 Tax=Streptomyces sp. SCUT-3 TaxID=2684469 RepID=UPI002175645A|nr:ATP-binding protein [Streptomyces sp. SCUT-3]